MAGVLEDRFPLPAVNDPRPVAGIVVLGARSAKRGGQTTFTRAASRMTEAVALALRYPDARLVFTGGSGALLAQEETTEAAAASRFFTALGIDPKRLVLEDQSRNNARKCGLDRKIDRPEARRALAAHHLGAAHAAFGGPVPEGRARSRALAGGFPHLGHVARPDLAGAAFSTNLTLADFRSPANGSG